jgi:hypothetical protein
VRTLVARGDVVQIEHAAEGAFELDQHAFTESGGLNWAHEWSVACTGESRILAA